MITIIADRHKYASPPPGAICASGPADYVPVRRHIRACLDQDEPLTVYATDPVVLGWLDDLQRYPETRVTWHVVDPGEEFTQTFGVMPAAPFTPRLIAGLQLDQLPRPPAGSFVHPLTWILGHRLDPIWQQDVPPPGHASALAAWALHMTAPLDEDLAALAQAQIERWSTSEPIYHEFHARNLTDDSTSLLIRWALQRYEGVWVKAQPWGDRPLLSSEPPPMALVRAVRSQHHAIQDYWSRRIADTQIDGNAIAAALSHMSGFSDAELSAIGQMLRRCPQALENRLLQTITSRFANLPTAEITLRDMAQLIAPPEPPWPEPEWSVERWLDWATQEYMPYYAWVIRGGHARDYQQACALRYSDWLYTHYPSWLNDDCSPLLLSQYQDLCTIIEQDARALVIWLIVDGMTWWQGHRLRDACAGYGLYPQAQRPAVAMLPSITAISKRALVTGQPTIDLTEPTIAEAARVKLARCNFPAVVGYSLPDMVEHLRERTDVRVAVVLFNHIDEHAHQTSAFTDNAGIRGYFEDLARELGKAQEACIEQGGRLHVLVGSDHGSTLLPPTTSSLPLPSAVCEIDDIWEPNLPGYEAEKPGTRAAATDLDHALNIDQHLWYILDRHRFQLDRHYLVPRGYSYIKRKPSGWTHGGLTPEETIVPLLHLAADRPRPRPIEIEVRGTLRAGQAGVVTAVLRNLNPFPIQDLTLLVSGSLHEGKIVQIGPLEQQEVQIHFAVIFAQGTELPVTYEIRYRAFGNPHCEEGRIGIPLRRLQTEDTSFDEMFS